MEGEIFYKLRVKSLKRVITLHPTSAHSNILTQGLGILDSQRYKYSSAGPKTLYNSLVVKPIPTLERTTVALNEAISFVDELVSLGFLQHTPHSSNILNKFLLFLVPKSGQPGEFRPIADGKTGGKNDVCVADPCHVTSTYHILPYLYK